MCGEYLYNDNNFTNDNNKINQNDWKDKNENQNEKNIKDIT